MTTTLATRAILYLRLSDFREDDPDSFPAREAKLRAMAEALGWQVARVIVENDLATTKNRGVSAFKKTTTRKGFREMLNDLREGRANAVLAEDLDRVARQPRDLQDLLDVAEDKKINARSLSGSLTLTDGGTDSERAMAEVMTTMANKSSRDTARRVRDGMERAIREGRSTGGGRMYGFETDGVTVRQTEADIVDELTRRIVQGQSLRSLVAELRDLEVPTITGAAWSPKTLRQILLRPRNAGWLAHHGEILTGDDGRPLPAPWAALVDAELFDAVTRVLTDPARSTTPGPARRHLLSGVAVCGLCGGPVQATHNSKGVRRYRCANHKHLARNAELAERVVVARTKTVLTDPVYMARFAAKVTGIDVGKLRDEAAAIRVNLNGMAEDRALGLIDRDQMLKATQAGHRRLKAINEAIASVVVSGSPAWDAYMSDNPGKTFDDAPLAVKQDIIRDCVTVTLMAARKGRRLDEESIVVSLKDEAVARWIADPAA